MGKERERKKRGERERKEREKRRRRIPKKKNKKLLFLADFFPSCFLLSFLLLFFKLMRKINKCNTEPREPERKRRVGAVELCDWWTFFDKFSFILSFFHSFIFPIFSRDTTMKGMKKRKNKKKARKKHEPK